MKSTVKLQRRITFSSGHRYWLPSLSEQQNRDLFGPWASPYNHGHNYVLWVTAEGEVDPTTGMVVNIKWIDDVLKERVIRPFDQKSINDEIPEFIDRSSSIENLLTYFADKLQQLPGDAKLIHLKLEEHPLLYGELDLTTPHGPMISITRIYEFAASHRLNTDELPHEENVRLYGKCNHINGHGHNYVLEVTVSGTPDPVTGMLADLGQLDSVVEERILNRYDHRNLDLDVEELAGKVTTSEVVAREIFTQLEGVVPGQLERVRLHETARNIFEVTR